MTAPRVADLGDGLVLRVAEERDVEELIALNTAIFDERITGWACDLLSGHHPTVRIEDFTVVEDLRARRIVSSTCLISQTWAYDGIPFGVGRPEFIATDPHYRRRGLVRQQFNVLHDLSAAKCELMQVITGIEQFYRRFGYEMGMQMWGSKCVSQTHLVSMPAVQDYRLRPATPSDHSFIQQLYRLAASSQLYSAVRPDEQWAYEFTGRRQTNTRRRDWFILEEAGGVPVGYVQYLPCLASPSWLQFRIYQVELAPGVSYLNIAPSLLRLLWEAGQRLVVHGQLACSELHGLELALERDHPLFRALPARFLEDIRPSPWYLRLPDVLAFVRHIRPALERHLVGSIAEGYTGTLRISLFRSGLVMTFQRGQIVDVQPWLPDDKDRGDARLPEAAFQHLVFGWRRFRNLDGTFPETSASDEAAALLDILFPPYNGKVWLLA